ncbi:hypothetical protein [Agrobacterium pusense]|uniref:Uncharacterized protein n=1 Tax=Agrobacterium pusense TaxID=648995 RepID=A0AA44EK15_9HYPH|nr:hypothetical protein [Agrobacterium pusense]NRF09351.1 hypothetical protein [Agrobacterium pusense]NRF19744.1 hypothetical protein [Agrobacterium pusense]
MDMVLLPHGFQGYVKVPEGDKNTALEFLYFFEVLKHSIHRALKFFRVGLRKFQPCEVYPEILTSSNNVLQVVIRLSVAIGEIAVEEVLCSFELFSRQDRNSFEAYTLQIFDDQATALRLTVEMFPHACEIDLGNFSVGVLKVSESRVDHPFHTQTIWTQLQTYEFAMTGITLLVGDLHLPYGIPSGDYCGSPANERLKIIYEVAPTIASALSRYQSRIPEEQEDQRCRSDHRGEESQHTFYCSPGHRQTLIPPIDRNRSHFLRALQSTAMRSAA